MSEDRVSPLRIVAIGASNTHGRYLATKAHSRAVAGPAPSQGHRAQATNARVPFETTAMMLRRIDKDVPNGTVEQVRVGHAEAPRFIPTRGLSLIPANVCRLFALSRWTRSSSLRDHHPDGSAVVFETALEGGGLSLRVFRSLRVLGEVEFSSREFAL
jgi:hypothetical protein